MKTLRTQLLLGFGALCALLALSAPAQAANSARFTLTAIVEGATVEDPTGIFKTPLTKVKITNKELLEQLETVYPAALTPGAVLSVNDAGEFVINDENGALLQAISDTVLDAQFSAFYRKGVADDNTNIAIFKNIWAPVSVLLNIDANNDFEIYGGMKGSLFAEGSTVRSSYLIQLAGEGTLDGADCYIEGKLALKHTP